MTIGSEPLCMSCKHLVDVVGEEWFEIGGYKCAAFPRGIPDVIMFGGFVHNQIHPDQEGDTVFEPVESK